MLQSKLHNHLKHRNQFGSNFGAARDSQSHVSGANQSFTTISENKLSAGAEGHLTNTAEQKAMDEKQL